MFDTSEGKRIAVTLGEGKAVILRNHGLLTAGHSVDEAVFWYVTMERTCQAQLASEAAGPTVKIGVEHARQTRDQIGSHVVGYMSFQPLYQRIVREQPDLLD